MGTPAFAVEPLKALLEVGVQVAAVVTVPDKPAGRGLKLHTSAVKDYALAQGLQILQPAQLNNPTFIGQLVHLQAEIGVVVAFRKLPRAVLELPWLGLFNLHASLLPQYRGAAPINWALINGECETGVTTFLLSEQIDAGQVLLQERIPLPLAMTAGELHDALAQLGSRLVVETVRGLADRTLLAKPQPECEMLKPAPKIFRADCRIDWGKSAFAIHNLIRGLSPFPGAWCHMQRGEKGAEDVKLFTTQPLVNTGKSPLPAGTASPTELRDELCVACGNGTELLVKEIQPASKKRMGVDAFLRGLGTEVPIRFS